MGIFSRIFRGQDGEPPDGDQEERDSGGGEAPADGTPEEAELEELTEPVRTPSAALAAATGGSASTHSPFSTPLWSWPQRSSEPNPTAPPSSAARQESPMAKPDDPAAPASRSRSP